MAKVRIVRLSNLWQVLRAESLRQKAAVDVRAADVHEQNAQTARARAASILAEAERLDPAN